MKFRMDKPGWQIALGLVLLGLLVTLATLQYRWLGQVSRGESERMRASLTTGAERFSQDFNRDISRAFFGFQLGGEAPGTGLEVQLAESYDRWQKSSEHPELVKELFIVGFDSERVPVLLRFDPSVRKLSKTEWPQDLAQLKQRLVEDKTGDIPEPPANERHPLGLDPLQADIPMLLAPVLFIPSPDRGAENSELRSLDSTHQPVYVGIRLDGNYIVEKRLPELAERYFKGSTGLDYTLRVVKANAPNEVVFHTADSKSELPSLAGDATVGLFDLRMEEAGSFRFTSARLPSPVGNDRSVTITRTKREVNSAPVGKHDQLVPANGKNVVLHVFNKEMSTGFSVRSTTPNGVGRWQLIARHRFGSLDTFIASTKRRNLFTSFGVLVLLAAGVGFVLLAARRSHRVAQQQLDFVSSVSHEFRTPLAVICSAGENLEDGIINEPAQIAKYGNLIRGEGRRLTEMVEQVLEFAGVQSGRKSYHLTEVAVGDLVNDALTACQSQIEAKHIVVESHLATNLPMVLADPMAMRQSIQNLIGNAVKYGSTGHWLGITVALGTGSKGAEIQVSIADRGMGIPESEQSRIFEPFYRGAEVVAAQIHGNGLGLSLVQRVVAAHHGRLSLKSNPGEGSVFTIHLPIASPAGSDTVAGYSALPVDGSLTN